MKNFMHRPDLGLLLFRLFIGLTMAFAHGWGKLPPPHMLVDGVASMGFPLPLFFAWCAALSEFVGGLLIATGLWTRLASASLVVTMGVAAFIAHGADPFEKKEMALLYLISSILLVFQGAGSLSLDRILRKK
ncbi:MAG: DoxX family protein [Bdellovibrionales bacterium]